MTQRTGWKALSGAVLVTLVLTACGTSSTNTGETLAADQTIRFPINEDIGTFDAAHISALVDFDFGQNVFDAPVKFDNTGKIVPDLLTALPDVSSDGLTWTFKLKHNVKFSNGDPVKADDVIYSWNRTALAGDSYASNFSPVVGFDDVSATPPKAKTMSGLSKTDDYTVVAKLSAPAGWWLSALALGGASWIVDQKVISAKGEDTWWTTPDGLVGTGPFKMTARVPKASLDFAPVSNWWGGSTGNIKKIHVDVIADPASWVTKYETGGYDIVGYANMAPTNEDILRYKAGTHAAELTLNPSVRSTWVGFNFTKGPFAGDAGKDGRKAFDMAIDRDQLVDVACAKGATCAKATGGFIPKGLKGYLGDGQDPLAKFDAAGAKALYQKWDPTGTKVHGLTYTFNASATNKATAENLQAQWQQNLGVTVKLETVDRQTFFKNRDKKSYIMFRHSWSADYDHPQDWFDNLYVCNAGSGGSGYCNKTMDDLVFKADQKPIDQALPDYIAAQKMMIDDAMGAPLYYGVQPYLIKPYVKGAGGNAFFDYYWTGMRVLQH
jgi:oligopeptide transport system substrate-binding protein